MLNKREETELDRILSIIEMCKEDGKYPMLSAYDMEWLASQLKEVNDEIKHYKENCKQMDRCRFGDWRG